MSDPNDKSGPNDESNPNAERASPQAPPPGRSMRWLILLLVIPGTLWATGALDYLRDTDRVRADVSQLGPLAPIAWILVHATLEGLGVPATFIVIAAMVLFTKPVALAVCVLGSAGGMAFGFCLARYLARDWVSARLPERFRQWESRVSDNAFLVSLGMRSFLFLAPGPAYVMGLSRARFFPCLLGALLGCIPGLWLMVYWGPEAVALSQRVPVTAWLVAAAVTVLAVLVVRRKRGNS